VDHADVQELPAHTDIVGVIWFEAFNVID